ncbi:MAG: TraB/GumN family protein [Gammaproteobacteria bacterium]|nr:hypothetical protein [Gammaproteobacteria bacterium]NIQ11279.1 TraB/GumN family protein [Gammaproteobacteria bacterium]NIQ20325.1 hypothetical protein [Gammaproteobacteria bacterium]NIQ74865.1 TraB/GumN family protein [Gammaproteobacteria bacterium]NIR95031.1 TraB/GumN family protein [Gammaproteobacteria bacterium]
MPVKNTIILASVFIFYSGTMSSTELTNLADICASYQSIEEDPEIKQKTRDSIPYGEGLLWKIEAKNGNSGYLFGTMHSQDRLITTSLPPPVNLAIHTSRIIMLEVIPDQQSNHAFSEAMYFNNDKELQSLLGDPLWTELARILPEYGLPHEAIHKLKPWAAFSLIGRPKPIRGPTLDMIIYSKALQGNKEARSLETMKELVNQLDGIPLDDQLEILTDTICNHKQIIRDTRTLRDLYIARDLAGIVLFNQSPHHDENVYQRYIKRMVYDRNLRMADRIEELMTEDGVFVAVGASHLPDKKGLLQLLSKRGYSVTQIY